MECPFDSGHFNKTHCLKQPTKTPKQQVGFKKVIGLTIDKDCPLKEFVFLDKKYIFNRTEETMKLQSYEVLEQELRTLGTKISIGQLEMISTIKLSDELESMFLANDNSTYCYEKSAIMINVRDEIEGASRDIRRLKRRRNCISNCLIKTPR